MALLLFDIDGTLLAPRGLGRRAFEKAVRALYQRLPETSFGYDGLMDTAIAKETLRLLGESQESGPLCALLDAYACILHEERPSDPESHLCPGVPWVLDEARSRGHHLGLLTGNLSKTAKTKLGFVSLEDHFPAGAFAEDADERGDLVPIAMARCASAYGRPFTAEETWIVGDSVHDIRAAKWAGVRCAAVATGNTPISVLEAESPHLLLEDLAHSHALWATVEASG